ncbi:phosphoserine transaminase [Bifidobacterium magnum]|uniref:phosphoserine transaminase n=1 Tax=Bifidobacterium magnum TaxID=1692 RepID=A0A087BBJ7_9BIFI|nr:phosphoserine transaminase [Bifidobacterium magnum]KFI68397.1 Phosphoserine aminotransferase [Bifidobacterium magnum]
MNPTDIIIPHDLLPQDGRFGSGPSKIRPAQIDALSAAGRTLLGTSHRQDPVKNVVGSIREGLSEFFHIPDGYEAVLGNGGASAFWDVICANVITRTAAVGVYGSFSQKMATSIVSAPFLNDPVIYESAPGTYRIPDFTPEADTYCWAHNETSTGVAAPVRRVPGSREAGALTVVDATSAAAALPVDISETDIYYFSPQKAFGSEGGLWIAILSPAAVERAFHIGETLECAHGERWIPPFLSLTSAITNSRKNQTLNTPSLSTLLLLDNQVRYLNEQGGLAWSSKHCADNAQLLYTWAEASSFANPFVEDPAARSNSVVTVDLVEDLHDSDVLAALRTNGIVDVSGYRKLGRNQLRVGVFPNVQTRDVAQLTHCIDYVARQLLMNS